MRRIITIISLALAIVMATEGLANAAAPSGRYVGRWREVSCTYTNCPPIGSRHPLAWQFSILTPTSVKLHSVRGHYDATMHFSKGRYRTAYKRGGYYFIILMHVTRSGWEHGHRVATKLQGSEFTRQSCCHRYHDFSTFVLFYGHP